MNIKLTLVMLLLLPALLHASSLNVNPSSGSQEHAAVSGAIDNPEHPAERHRWWWPFGGKSDVEQPEEPTVEEIEPEDAVAEEMPVNERTGRRWWWPFGGKSDVEQPEEPTVEEVEPEDAVAEEMPVNGRTGRRWWWPFGGKSDVEQPEEPTVEEVEPEDAVAEEMPVNGRTGRRWWWPFGGKSDVEQPEEPTVGEVEPEDAVAEEMPVNERTGRHWWWPFGGKVADSDSPATGAQGSSSTDLVQPPARTNIVVLPSPRKKIVDPPVRPGHVLSITVVVAGAVEILEPEKRVSASGMITLPLIGIMAVEGLNTADLAVKLRKIYSEYFREPMLDVSFVADRIPGAVSPWGYVTLLGHVRQPGRINIPPTQDLALSMAVQLAGGLDESAKDTAIRVSRRLSSGDMSTRVIDLKSAASNAEIENDIKLEAGDIIYVPQKVF